MPAEKIDLEKFEKEELPRMIKCTALLPIESHEAIRILSTAFTQAMAELREEREKIRKSVIDKKFTENCQEDQSVSDSVYHEQQLRIGYNLACDHIAEEIRRGK